MKNKKTKRNIDIITSKRFCGNCLKKQKFALNPVLNHSECIECGSRYSFRSKKNYESFVKDRPDLEKNQLKNEITILKDDIKQQRKLIAFLYYKLEGDRK